MVRSFLTFSILILGLACGEDKKNVSIIIGDSIDQALLAEKDTIGFHDLLDFLENPDQYKSPKLSPYRAYLDKVNRVEHGVGNYEIIQSSAVGNDMGDALRELSQAIALVESSQEIDHVVFALGTNDFCQQTDDFTENLKALLAKLTDTSLLGFEKLGKAKFSFISPFNVTQLPVITTEFEGLISAVTGQTPQINLCPALGDVDAPEKIKEMTQEMIVLVAAESKKIDGRVSFADFSQLPNELTEEDMAPDGFHPSVTGIEKITQAINKRMTLLDLDGL